MGCWAAAIRRGSSCAAVAAAAATASEESWSYDYVPGAGDDEESWACGLIPQLMWLHRDALVQAGPAGVHGLLADLLQGPGRGPPQSTSEQHRQPLSEHRPGDIETLNLKPTPKDPKLQLRSQT